ncbi:MAG: serine hydrolase [Actinomycetes bacterium]
MTLPDWQSTPHNRWSFQHVDELVPSVEISRGTGPTLELVDTTLPIELEVDDFLARSSTDGFIVLRGREVLVERYLNGMKPGTRHLLQSVSKSMCSAVFGRYVESDQIAVDEPVGSYLPELADSAYGDATVQQVLDMTVAVAYDEEYTDPESEVQTHERVGRWRTPLPTDPVDTYAFLAGLKKSGDHGRKFAYCSANTEVLAWLLERVSGRPYAELLHTDLWAALGAQHDGSATVDAAGFPMASGGVSVTLRDLARFGRVILDAAQAPDGASVIPAAWVADMRRGGDRAAAAESMGDVHPHGSYRNQFWVTGDRHGCFYGVGIYGQYVWMNPAADVVIAKMSSLPVADDQSDWGNHVSFFENLSHGLVPC